MAARNTPSAGGKPDKILRDALMIELKRETKDETGNKTSKFNVLVAKLVEKGMQGNDASIKEIWDRMEGKPAQSIAIGQDEDLGPIRVTWET